MLRNIQISNQQRNWHSQQYSENNQLISPKNLFFAIKNSFTTIKKNYFEKIHDQLFNNQSLELSSSSEIDKIIQEEEATFKKNPTVGLPEASKLIDSAISKRQGNWRKNSFLERKKVLHERENGLIMNTQNITSLNGSCYEAIHSSISLNIFSHLKMFSMQWKKKHCSWR